MPESSKVLGDVNLLFAAFVLRLFATGIATVALALLAYDLTGGEAGSVLGTALALKMAANIVVPPLLAVFGVRIDRRPWMVCLALAMAAAILTLPVVTQVWQLYVLTFLFQAASAAAHTTYLAVVPDMLPDKRDYLRAVTKSRITYHAETLISPLVAAALIAVLDFRGVFVLSVGLLIAAAVVTARTRFPEGDVALGNRLSRKLGHFGVILRSRDLLGALAIDAAAITVTAMVTVNTVVMVRAGFGLDDRAVAIGLAAFGAGGIVAGLLLVSSVTDRSERLVMMAAGATLAPLLMLGAAMKSYEMMLVLWMALGAASTIAQLPTAALLQRFSRHSDRYGLYAANQTLNHIVLLAAYLAAGWVGSEASLPAAFIGLGLFSAAMVLMAAMIWRPNAVLSG